MMICPPSDLGVPNFQSKPKICWWVAPLLVVESLHLTKHVGSIVWVISSSFNCLLVTNQCYMFGRFLTVFHAYYQTWLPLQILAFLVTLLQWMAWFMWNIFRKPWFSPWFFHVFLCFSCRISHSTFMPLVISSCLGATVAPVHVCIPEPGELGGMYQSWGNDVPIFVEISYIIWYNNIYI